MKPQILEISFKPAVKEDFNMLKRVVVGWNKFANISKTYIIGEFTKDIVNKLEETLEPLSKKIDIEIISIYNPYKEGTRRVFHQILEFSKMTGYKNFIHAHDDTIPIRPIKMEYFNKEYKLYRRDYKKYPREQAGWFVEKQIQAIEWFCNKYNLKTLPLCEHHYLYYLDEKFFDFVEANPEVVNFHPDDILTFRQLTEGNKSIDDILIPNLIGTTWHHNVWQYKKNIPYVAVNFTLPSHPKTKNLLKKLTTTKL